MIIEELQKKYAAGERNFTDLNLFEANLTGINLSGANLSGVNLSVANLSGANLTNSNLSKAKLNIAKLNGAHLSGTNLNGADLNVANLVLVNLKKARLIGAKLIRAELIRAELSEANLALADLSGASLVEATLRKANLSNANLKGANLRFASLTGSNLIEANLQGADLSGADLSGVNLSGSELRQTNLNGANLNGSDLSGANLRWADLSGAQLKYANLSDAKLSGANLSRGDLFQANLLNTSLVHANLSSTCLIEVDWIGVDLTGATLTGAKIFGASRLGIKAEAVICKWLDLSASGDKSQVYSLNSETIKNFFHESVPQVNIIVDTSLDSFSHYALATTYYQISKYLPELSQPPSIEINSCRTIISFSMDSDEKLFSTAYIAILPFLDAAKTQENIVKIMKIANSQDLNFLTPVIAQIIRQFSTVLNTSIKQVNQINKNQVFLKSCNGIKFFQTPTKISITNSSGQKFNIYYHPKFGKRIVNKDTKNSEEETIIKVLQTEPYSISTIFDFINGFYQPQI
ncbi:pentapeptide repeat-containing protein [Okeania sp.]|uniref:pentapeptide repeat-containing protein n=1 Tax=Okeania sp. TaxID=3100323 RepID=UPI002B4B90DD|nr:pentapeptide repeat-containing protein [Okeania sp.]MEB3343529.1 pentapeptide repeat-containing protein [Okeania sp.]